MARSARSARGQLVDFDVLAIKQALSVKPLTVGTDERRQFIDSKDGIRPKAQNALIEIQPVENATALIEPSAMDAMALAFDAARSSALVDDTEEAPE